MTPENDAIEGARQDGGAESRPDWDPYAVWQTHIMSSPEDRNASPERTDTDDDGWNPYNVWQSMIKG